MHDDRTLNLSEGIKVFHNSAFQESRGRMKKPIFASILALVNRLSGILFASPEEEINKHCRQFINETLDSSPSLALVLLLVAEFTLVLRPRGLSIHEYPATRDPFSGAV